VRLLLDTHVLLWAIASPRRLSPEVRRVIETTSSVSVSVVSVWEIGIKRALGKLESPDDLLQVMKFSGFDALPVGLDHALLAGGLPRHHDDPFDRLLIAQAEIEDLTIVTADRHFAKYDVRVLAA
jgi:PIN domain nuclease of toxin-antitoxin system